MLPTKYYNVTFREKVCGEYFFIIYRFNHPLVGNDNVLF